MGYSQILLQSRRYFIQCAAAVAASFLVGSACGAQAKPEGQAPEAEAAWIQELNNKYPGLLAEFGRLVDKFQHTLQFPPPRGESRLLPLLPEATMSYGAFPNYGDVAHQALKVFRQELQESAVLRDLWQRGELAAAGPKVEDSLEKFYQLSQYLGDEIVVSGVMEGREPKLLIVVEVRKPGLKKFLQQMIDDLAGKSKPGVRVLDPQELAAAKDARPADELLVLVRPDYVVGALDLATLRSFNARLDRRTRGYVATPLGQRVAQAYEGGVTVLAAADVHKILNQVPPGTKQEQMTLQRTGFADMKYLVWEHKKVAGQEVSEAELSFIAPRHGVASWLAKPAPLGSLDFVSPKAMLAGTVVLTSPAQIFEDVKELASASDSNAFATLSQAEQGLKLSLKEDLLSYLGGEITAEVEDVTSPVPVWKAILRVNEPGRLQQTLSTLLAAAHIEVAQADEGPVTYYTVRIPSSPTSFEIGYAFVQGYLIIASSRETVVEAVRLHATGESLGKSEKFLASLPPGHSPGASALLYQDPLAMMSLRLRQRQLPPEMAGSLAQQLAGESTPGVIYVYGEETAIREASRSSVLDAGAVLVIAAIAIPNLLRSRMAANEASAVGSVRTVNTAQVMYTSTYPQRGYAPNLAALGPDPRGPNAQSPDHASFVDNTLGNESCTADAWCTKSGFHFRLTAVCKQHLCKEYVVVATPVDDNAGARNFCSTSDGVVRFQLGPPLTSPLSVAECKAWQPLQ
jgi:type II secretory pathway pseudopilin PulG